jgi:type I protein arginine methyltransferase
VTIPPSERIRNEYSLAGYGEMIADRIRIDAYRNALARVVKQDSIVLDLGAGTGILSLLACTTGAAHVYAIEPSDMIEVGTELARANGFADRITFIQAFSQDVMLPRPATILISDLRGVLPLHGAHLPTIIDVRRRLLAADAILIPQADTIRAQLVGDRVLHERTVGPWRTPQYGLDLSAALRWAPNRPQKANLVPNQLIGEAASLATLHYPTIDSANVRSECIWKASGDALAHGLALWFDASLAPGVSFSNAPSSPRTIYGQFFFPFPDEVALTRGDNVAVTIDARLVDDIYIWRWRTTVSSTAGAVKEHFDQSTFQGTPISAQRLKELHGDG